MYNLGESVYLRATITELPTSCNDCRNEKGIIYEVHVEGVAKSDLDMLWIHEEDIIDRKGE